jgi:hypothetical protein
VRRGGVPRRRNVFSGTAENRKINPTGSHGAAMSFLEELENENSEEFLQFGVKPGGLKKILMTRQAKHLRSGGLGRADDERESELQEYFRRAKAATIARRKLRGMAGMHKSQTGDGGNGASVGSNVGDERILKIWRKFRTWRK